VYIVLYIETRNQISL